MSHYSLKELQAIEFSIDDIGVLYFYKDRIFRAINRDHIEHIIYLFDSGFIPEAIEKNMFPNTWISSDTIEGYELVLEHEKIAPWNYPYEWSFNMLKDAAIMVLELTKIAESYGLSLVDGHYYNVTFNKCRPTYIDLGSFRKIGNRPNGWIGFTDFYYSFFAPLKLWNKGLYSVSRNASLSRTLLDQKEFIRLNHKLIPNSIITLLDTYTALKYRVICTPRRVVLTKLANKKFQRLAYRLASYTLTKTTNPITLIKKIDRLTPPRKSTMWTHYHRDHARKDKRRLQHIINIIKSLENCSSVVEVGANHGKLSLEVAKQTPIEEIISTDYDETAVDKMYLLSKTANTISPLVINTSLPDGRVSDIKITERIKSDIAIGLALTHHLILTQGFPLELILKQFKEIAYKYVIIEFMPLGLYGGDLDKPPSLPDYYTTEWFRSAFTSVFELVLDEKLEDNRHVFVGKIIK